MKISTSDLTRDFVVITPDKAAVCVPMTPTVYQDLDRDFNNFAGHELVSVYDFDNDWASWEMHPAGDEVVALLSGKVTFLLEVENVVQSVVLEIPGSYVIVPKGVWHSVRTSVLTRMLFITPGEGTLHRAL